MHVCVSLTSKHQSSVQSPSQGDALHCFLIIMLIDRYNDFVPFGVPCVVGLHDIIPCPYAIALFVRTKCSSSLT